MKMAMAFMLRRAHSATPHIPEEPMHGRTQEKVGLSWQLLPRLLQHKDQVVRPLRFLDGGKTSFWSDGLVTMKARPKVKGTELP